MITTEQIKSDIERLEKHIYCAELSDNRYATSGRWDNDRARLKELREKLEGMENA